MGRKRKIADEEEIRVFCTDIMRGKIAAAKPSERMKAAEILLKRFDIDGGIAAEADAGGGDGQTYGVVLIPEVNYEKEDE